MVYKLTKVYTIDTCQILLHTKMWTNDTAINALKNIIPLHTKTQEYHLMYPNVLL